MPMPADRKNCWCVGIIDVGPEAAYEIKQHGGYHDPDVPCWYYLFSPSLAKEWDVPLADKEAALASIAFLESRGCKCLPIIDDRDE